MYRDKDFTVFMLCAEEDPTFCYIGWTQNLSKNIAIHQDGQVAHTRMKRPLFIGAYLTNLSTQPEAKVIKKTVANQKPKQNKHEMLTRTIQNLASVAETLLGNGFRKPAFVVDKRFPSPFFEQEDKVLFVHEEIAKVIAPNQNSDAKNGGGNDNKGPNENHEKDDATIYVLYAPHFASNRTILRYCASGKLKDVVASAVYESYSLACSVAVPNGLVAGKIVSDMNKRKLTMPPESLREWNAIQKRVYCLLFELSCSRHLTNYNAYALNMNVASWVEFTKWHTATAEKHVTIIINRDYKLKPRKSIETGKRKDEFMVSPPRKRQKLDVDGKEENKCSL